MQTDDVKPHHDERELAEYIRDGMKRRPEQAFGDYYTGQNASCALGAAYEAMYRLPAEASGQHPTRDLDWFFDCLDKVKPCPGEGCRKRLYLAALLVHLNDDHRWTRDQIATWLAPDPAKALTPNFRSLVVGLAIVSVIFWILERWRPSNRAQRRRGVDTRVDLAYWFFTPLITKAVTRVSLGVVLALVAWSQGLTFDELRRLSTTRQTWATSLPIVVQVPLILVLGDLLSYWSHRLFHGRWLWPFHAVHHSSTAVDWLSSVRLHPVNDAVSKLFQVLPLYWMGFNGLALAAFVPILTFYAILLHANVGWSYGPLRYVIASPVFHRWHHTSEAEGLNTNFAGLFPWIDLVFGTFYMPPGRQPENFGIVGQVVPDGLFSQLLYPFRRRRPHSAEL